MIVNNEMSLSFPSKSCNEAFARCVVSGFLMSLDPTINELSDLKTAVSEAVTNCIVHGYRRQDGIIYIKGKIKNGNHVVIRIRDKGCGIADVKKQWNLYLPLHPKKNGQVSVLRLCKVSATK